MDGNQPVAEWALLRQVTAWLTRPHRAVEAGLVRRQARLAAALALAGLAGMLVLLPLLVIPAGLPLPLLLNGLGLLGMLAAYAISRQPAPLNSPPLLVVSSLVWVFGLMAIAQATPLAAVLMVYPVVMAAAFYLPGLAAVGALVAAAGYVAIHGAAPETWTALLLMAAVDAILVVVAAFYQPAYSQAHRASRALDTATGRLRMLAAAVEHSPASVVIADPAGNILYVNPGFEQLTGYTLPELLGRNPRILKTGYTSDEEYAQMWATITGGQVWRGTFLNRKKDGSLYWEQAAIAPVTDEDGAITHFVAVKENITERVEAEQALQHSEQRFRQMFEQNPAIKLLIDPASGRLVDANPAAVTFYGYPRERLLAMRIQDINILGEAEIQAKMQAALNEERTFFTFQHRLASGELREVDVFSGPVGVGADRYLYSIIADVTGKRKADARRERLLSHLKFLNRSALELADLHTEGAVYDYLGRQLEARLADVYIVINKVLREPPMMRTQGLYGADEALLARVTAALGFVPVGREFPIRPPMLPQLTQSRLIGLGGGLATFAEGRLPEATLKQVAALTGIQHIYHIGLVKEGVLYASLQFLAQRPLADEYTDLIEAFVGQASTALQRVEAAQALQRQSDEQAILLDNIPVQLWYLTDPQTYGRVNTAHAEFMGLPKAAMTGQNAAALYEPGRFRDCLADNQRVFESKQPSQAERWLADARGELRLLSVTKTPHLNGQGEVDYLVCTAVDITERQRMQEQLMASEERLRSTMDNMQDVLWSLRIPDFELEYINPAIERITGRPTTAFFTNPDFWAMVIHPDDQHLLNRAIANPLQNPEQEWEVRMLRPDGEVRWVYGRSWHRRDAEGRLTHLEGIVTDITERKQAQQREFEMALERERRQLLGRFVQTAAHEFRTPLAAISNYSYLMVKAGVEDGRGELRDKIDRQVSNITDLVNKLIKMIDLEEAATAGFAQVDMAKLLRGLHDLYRGPAFELADELPAVQGEANLLADAIRELLDNAVRFTPNGGPITLRARAQGKWLLVEVEDTGTGIAPGDLARIFETFWRQDKAHTTRGFGLGLPLVQRVVELHGGHVEVESQPGEGSLFRVVLPAIPLGGPS